MNIDIKIALSNSGDLTDSQFGELTKAIYANACEMFGAASLTRDFPHISFVANAADNEGGYQGYVNQCGYRTHTNVWDHSADTDLDIPEYSYSVDATEPCCNTNAKAEEDQLCLFKSIRRKPTGSEMMREIVDFCRRG
jgi:hypothetical protein